MAPANYVTPIPDGLPSEIAAPLLCGGVTVYSALNKCCAQPVGFLAAVKSSLISQLQLISCRDVGSLTITRDKVLLSQGQEVGLAIWRYKLQARLWASELS